MVILEGLVVYVCIVKSFVLCIFVFNIDEVGIGVIDYFVCSIE